MNIGTRIDQINEAIAGCSPDDAIRLKLDTTADFLVTIGSKMWNGGKPYAIPLDDSDFPTRLEGSYYLTGMAYQETDSGAAIVSALVKDDKGREEYGVHILPVTANKLAGIALGEPGQYFKAS